MPRRSPLFWSSWKLLKPQGRVSLLSIILYAFRQVYQAAIDLTIIYEGLDWLSFLFFLFPDIRETDDVLSRFLLYGAFFNLWSLERSRLSLIEVNLFIRKWLIWRLRGLFVWAPLLCQVVVTIHSKHGWCLIKIFSSRLWSILSHL